MAARDTKRKEPPSSTAPRRDQFGDIVVTSTGPDWDDIVTTAPDLTRISLALFWKTPLTVDEHGLNIANQVWYTPIDIGPNLTLICRKTRDLRPEKIQTTDPTHQS